MLKVDAIGQVCPMPVIMTKNALKSLKTGLVEVSVDNEISLQNLEKMSQDMGYSYNVETVGEIYKIIINKEKDSYELKQETESVVVVIDSDTMGNGAEELGKILMKGFVYTLSEMEYLPSVILLYNSGVKLAIEGSTSLEDLQKLEARGVEILSCGTCLNYYELTSLLRVGTITNMYSIIEKQFKANRIIKP